MLFFYKLNPKISFLHSHRMNQPPMTIFGFIITRRKTNFQIRLLFWFLLLRWVSCFVMKITISTRVYSIQLCCSRFLIISKSICNIYKTVNYISKSTDLAIFMVITWATTTNASTFRIDFVDRINLWTIKKRNI